jgi:hypothetical protein
MRMALIIALLFATVGCGESSDDDYEDGYGDGYDQGFFDGKRKVCRDAESLGFRVLQTLENGGAC